MTANVQILEVQRTLRRDSRYKRLKEAIDTLPAYQLSVNALEREIVGIHKVRDARRLMPNKNRMVERLIEAASSEQGHRSRVAEIKMECLRAKMPIERALSKLNEYFMLEYAYELKVVRTREERLWIIRSVTRNITDFISNLELLMEQCDIIVQDIDKGSWALTTMQKALEMHTKKEFL